MFETGDIVGCYAPTVGYRKYHLCICGPDQANVGWFLFINSENKFEPDFVLRNSDIPCIPENDTGLSVISCSYVVRLNAVQLTLYKAEKLGELDSIHISNLSAFMNTSKALPRPEKVFSVEKLSAKLNKPK